MGEGFAMGLGGEFFQRQLGLLQGLALGAESGVAQTRAHVGAFKAARGCCSGTTRAKAFAAPPSVARAPARRIAAVSTVTAVAPFETPAHGRSGFGFFHARSVVTAHGHDLFGWKRWGHWHQGWRGLGCGLNCGVVV